VQAAINNFNALEVAFLDLCNGFGEWLADPA
jgi:hypothetical protein